MSRHNHDPGFYALNISSHSLQFGNTALHVTALHSECCNVPDLMQCGINPYIENKVANKLAFQTNIKSVQFLEIFF